MKDSGRVTGSREPDPSCTGSGPSGFDPARVVTLRGIIRDIPARFAASYSRDRGQVAWRGDCTIGDIIDRLNALDTTTATPSDVAAIIGNDSWAKLECDHCGRSVEIAATLGDEPDYESRTAVVCLACVKAAAKAMEASNG